VAGAYSEHVPLVVITSSPTRAIVSSGRVVHHSLARGADYDVFMRMHQHVTGAAALLTPQNAAAELERVLAVCLRDCVPVYLCVPQDVAEEEACGPAAAPAQVPPSDPEALAQVVRLIADWANSAQRPVVLADIGVQRAHIHADLVALLEATGMPCATLPRGAHRFSCIAERSN
jgi:TPP-dependent 2-oxoacid decarboxylase